MTREQAIKTAADWWIEQIKSGNWDNGDAKTELMRGMFASTLPPLTTQDLEVIREVIEKLYDAGDDLYSDYGNGQIDDACAARGVKFSSMLQGPQKAGARIEKKGEEFVVLAKDGYGAPFVDIPPLAEQRERRKR